MKAEEYLKTVLSESTFVHDKMGAVSYEDALKAVQMAREEVKISADAIIEATRDSVKLLSDVEFERHAILAAISGLCANPNYTNMDDSIALTAVAIAKKVSKFK